MSVSSPIKKIRTFRDDVALVRGDSETVKSTPDASHKPVANPDILITRPKIDRVPRITEVPPPVIPKPVAPVVSPVVKTPISTPKPVVDTPKVEPALSPVIAVPDVKPMPEIAAELAKIKTTPEAPSHRSTGRDLAVLETDSVVNSGNIITDKKKDRFHLLSATWNALTEWVATEKARYEKREEKKRKAIPTVRPAEERRDIVKKASVQTAQAPKDDHAKVAAARPAKTESKPVAAPVVSIKSKEAVPKPSWAHYENLGEVSKTEVPEVKASPLTVGKVSTSAPEIPITKITPEVKPTETPAAKVEVPPAIKTTTVSDIPKTQLSKPVVTKPTDGALNVTMLDLPPVSETPEGITVIKPLEKAIEVNNEPHAVKVVKKQSVTPSKLGVAKDNASGATDEIPSWSHYVDGTKPETVKKEPASPVTKPTVAVAEKMEPVVAAAPVQTVNKVEVPSSETVADVISAPIVTPPKVIVEPKPITPPPPIKETPVISTPSPVETKVTPPVRLVETPVIQAGVVTPTEKPMVPKAAEVELPKPEQAGVITSKEAKVVEAPPRTFVPQKRKSLIGFSFVARAVAVAVVSMMFGIGVAGWLFSRDDSSLTPAEQPTAALVRADERIPLNLENDLSSMARTMETASVRSAGAVALFDLRVGDSRATTEQVLSLLRLGTPGTFDRSVEEINLGRYQDRPFIVIKINSFDNGFGGMLQAEQNLGANLSPLFGSTISNRPFIDDTIKNHDLRALQDEMRRELLVYGFVNLNTIIIAPTREAFAAVAEVIR